ncbi:hypothetical protein C8J56DRAFT_357632 [Mycena floridula]|nr:hypothetical protein C8J56DRAFT_357632 [Mycena floridula]
MGRKVYLPLESLGKCHICQEEASSFCSSCKEKLYCSKECQKKDWTEHKAACGKNDAINMASFYPYLAWLADYSRHMARTPINTAVSHLALCHQVINAPNPGSKPYPFPDGDAANLVVLGDPCKVGDDNWWPDAASPPVMRKMLRRILREGLVLPILTALSISLLAEVYTTDFDPADSKSRRIRLCGSGKSPSPIADFGIISGSAKVTNQDKLAYLKLGSDETEHVFSKGQDPNDHYWLYFTNIRGDTEMLDCSMYTFNMCTQVHMKGYVSDQELNSGLDWVPAIFIDKEMSRTIPNLYPTQRKRVSVLRNLQLHEAIRDSFQGFQTETAMKAVYAFMQGLSRKPINEAEKKFTIMTLNNMMSKLRETVKSRSWKKWPTEPQMGIEADPGEETDGPDDIIPRLKRWNSKVRKGEMTEEAVAKAFRKYNAKHRA